MSRFQVNVTHHAKLVHSGGTKFWEVVALHCPLTKRDVVVRRWGKIANSNKGGEVLVEQEGLNHVERLIKDKFKRGYEVDPVTFSGALWFRDLPTGNVTDIYNGLSVALGNTLVFDENEDEVVEVIAEAPKKAEPEPNRGADWGSW